MRATRESLIEPAELAQLLGVSLKTLSNWRCQRSGPLYMKVGRRVLYGRESIERWLDRQETTQMKEMRKRNAIRDSD